MSVYNSSAKYRVNPDFILRQIAGDAVLVPTGNTAVGNSMLEVNETFRFLWELFSQPTSIAEAAKIAREKYEDPDGQLEHHIVGFIHDCLKYGMLLEEE